VLLLHGGLGDARTNWREIAPVLAEHYRVAAPDLPGFGTTEKLETPGIAGLLGWIDGLREHLAAERVIVVGHSLGALLARLYAAAHPVDGLVLINGGALPNVPPMVRTLARLPLTGQVLFGWLAGSVIKELDRAVVDESALNETVRASIQANRSLFSRMLHLLGTDALPEARNPAVPALVIWGVADTINVMQPEDQVRAVMPKVQFQTIADCGHMPQIETPDVCAWQITRFIDQLDRPTRPNLPGVSLLNNGT
jgi:pimeloyl-ACP methyl ester carboxylesterase